MRRFAVFAALLAAFGAVAGCTNRGSAPAGQAAYANAPVVIISVDTLRADHLPAYGYGAVATPSIDRLRRDAVLFRNAYAQVPLTLPSHASLFTGLLPFEHGVRDNLGYTLDAQAHKTLAAAFREKGFATGGFVSAYVLRSATGIAGGFDTWDDKIEGAATAGALGSVQRRGDATLSAAKAWLGTVAARPFFLFLHVYEPHLPYEPPEPYKSRYAAQPYDGEIAKSDEIVGGLLDELRRLSVYDKAVVVFLSDHGEGLGEHGEDDHGILLYRWALHVPLLVKLPAGERAGSVVESPTALVDVFPTLTAMAGIAAPKDLAGKPLFAAASGERSIYAETYYPRIHLGWSPLRSMIDSRFHYIEGAKRELYDHVNDPGETADRVANEPANARALQAALGRYPEKLPARPSGVSAADLEKLAALGYLGGGTEAVSGPLPDPRERIGVLEDVRAAFRLAKAGRDEDAVALFARILDANPALFDARYEMGQAYERLGRYQDAFAAFKTALRGAPSLAGPLSLEIGRVAFRLGKLDEAEANARVGLAANAPAAHELLSRIALGRDDLAAAEREARAARTDSTAVAANLGGAVVLAEVAVRRGQVAEALALLDEAKRGRAEGELIPDIDFLRGDALARLNRYDEAEAAFRAEIRRFPRNTQAYTRLAVVFGLQKKTVGELERLLNDMVKADPRQATFEAAARTLEAMGDREGARQWRRRGASRPMD